MKYSLVLEEKVPIHSSYLEACPLHGHDLSSQIPAPLITWTELQRFTERRASAAKDSSGEPSGRSRALHVDRDHGHGHGHGLLAGLTPGKHSANIHMFE